MSQTSEIGGCIVVVEQGAEWHEGAARDRTAGLTERAIIAQQREETPAELAVRAARRAKQLSVRAPLQACVVAASESLDDEVFHSRCQIARSMIAAMRGAQGARLLFVAGAGLSDAGRHELMALVGTLTGQLHGTSVEVGIRFEPPREQRAQSGVHRIAETTELVGAACG